jgi:hypothetical protein
LKERKPTNQPDKTSRDPNLAALKKRAAEQDDRFKLKQKPQTARRLLVADPFRDLDSFKRTLKV